MKVTSSSTVASVVVLAAALTASARPVTADDGLELGKCFSEAQSASTGRGPRAGELLQAYRAWAGFNEDRMDTLPHDSHAMTGGLDADGLFPSNASGEAPSPAMLFSERCNYELLLRHGSCFRVSLIRRVPVGQEEEPTFRQRFRLHIQRIDDALPSASPGFSEQDEARMVRREQGAVEDDLVKRGTGGLRQAANSQRRLAKQPPAERKSMLNKEKTGGAGGKGKQGGAPNDKTGEPALGKGTAGGHTTQASRPTDTKHGSSVGGQGGAGGGPGKTPKGGAPVETVHGSGGRAGHGAGPIAKREAHEHLSKRALTSPRAQHKDVTAHKPQGPKVTSKHGGADTAQGGAPKPGPGAKTKLVADRVPAPITVPKKNDPWKQEKKTSNSTPLSLRMDDRRPPGAKSELVADRVPAPLTIPTKNDPWKQEKQPPNSTPLSLPMKDRRPKVENEPRR